MSEDVLTIIAILAGVVMLPVLLLLWAVAWLLVRVDDLTLR